MSNEQKQSVAARKDSLHLRKETQARESAAAWAEYNAREAAMRTRTAELRAQRLARDAAATTSVAPATTARVRTGSK
jgi:hypothetical protein